MPSVSIVAVVKNEERNIDAFLDTIGGFADELVLVDTGSSDATIAKVKEREGKLPFPVKFFEAKFNPYHHGIAKNYAIERGTCDYIFILDADERLSDDLKKNLKPWLAKHHPNLTSVPRIDEHVSHLIDPQQRVVRRESHIRYDEDGASQVHCEFAGRPKPLEAPYPMYHLQGENHWLKHPSRFMGQLRLEVYGRENTRGLLRETIRGIIGFYYKFKQVYFRKEAYKDGWSGFAYAILKSFYGLLLHIKVGLKPREK